MHMLKLCMRVIVDILKDFLKIQQTIKNHWTNTWLACCSHLNVVFMLNSNIGNEN